MKIYRGQLLFLILLFMSTIAYSQTTTLINGLGGDAGFGDATSFGRTDDDAHGPIDVTPIFGDQGVKFGGNFYTDVYININGC